MSGVCVATPEVLCGNVPLRVTGEIGPSAAGGTVEVIEGGEMGGGLDMVVRRLAAVLETKGQQFTILAT
jgi:hypothetical protein